MWETEGQKERILSAVLHSLELDLSRLWKLDVPEEEFVNLYSKVHATPISCFFLLVFSFSFFFFLFLFSFSLCRNADLFYFV